ncbi:MAG: acetolactate synthase-1/2/3 large subunit [Verrucomicrobiales bacterium]|jgi:acetolactate synthase-1/2/3 large subunit
MRTGGQLVVDALVSHGVTTAFGVPGESYLAVLDALHDTDINFVICRQEGGAAYAAEAWGRLTGDPGICMVTRGPGATNASVGIHAAMENSQPMMVLIGQVATGEMGREAFQEIDYRRFLDPITKWVTQVDDVDELAEALITGFQIAVSGRPGPVAIALPEDMLRAATKVTAVEPRPIERATPSNDEIDSIIRELADAERPVIIAGGGRWTEQARVDLTAFAVENDIPVVPAFRFHDLVDNLTDIYVGEAGVGMMQPVKDTIRSADVILGLGIRFGEMTTAAWTLIDLDEPTQRIVHVHPDPIQLGRIYPTAVGVIGDPSVTIGLLRDRVVDHGDRRAAWRHERRSAYIDAAVAPPQPGALDMGVVMRWLQDNLPPDVIVTNGAGNFSIWPNKLLRYGADARLLAPQNGTMGYGLPAAIAAKAAHPERTVVCFAGDGDLQMNIQELGTARQAGIEPIVLVLDNGMYGTIRAHQERNYPERESGTKIVNPDFVALARAYGMHSELVERTNQFPGAFERAKASPTGALLHLRVPPEMLSPWESIDDARARNK